MQREAERVTDQQKSEFEDGGSNARKLGQRSREVWVASDVMKEKDNVAPGNREEGREINKQMAGTELGDGSTLLRSKEIRKMSGEEAGQDVAGQRM